MTDSGFGFGTPVSGGAGTGISLAQPYPPTILSLGMYARIMGINPLHFAGGLTPNLDPSVHPVSGCSGIWHKYDWQDHDKVSLYQIAQLIHEAEREVADVVGYWPGPYWTEEEMHQYPRPFLRDAYGNGYDVRDRPKAVNTRYGKIISAGVRAVSLIGTATTLGGSLAYTDEDSDGFYETATVTMATTLTNVNEIKVYFSGTGGAIEWEIRPVKTKSIAGGIATLVFNSWDFINPELYELPITSDDEHEYIDVSTVSNFVTSVDVYREYIDTTQNSAIFYWSDKAPTYPAVVCPSCGIIGCTTCSYDSQNGCAIARSINNTELVVTPASYDATSGTWSPVCWTNCKEPDIVKVYYLSGNQAQEYLQGRSFDPLSLFWARIVAWIATARLDRPVCDCGSFKALVDDLTRDITLSLQGEAFFVPNSFLDNPFGMRKGEVKAWRAIAKTVKDKRASYAVI